MLNNYLNSCTSVYTDETNFDDDCVIIMRFIQVHFAEIILKFKSRVFHFNQAIAPQAVSDSIKKGPQSLLFRDQCRCHRSKDVWANQA